MLGSKGILPPTDTNELLRCDATFAILKTFGFADFSKKQLTRAYHAQNRPIGLNRCILMFLRFPSSKPYRASANGF